MSFRQRLTEARQRVEGYAHGFTTFEVPGRQELDPSVARAFWIDEFGTGGALDASLLDAARRAKASRYGDTLFAIVPVYVTSVCVEHCLYCNFRAGNKGVELQRVRLSPEELEKEVEYLAGAKGLRVMELVYATDPLVRVDRMCRDVEQLRELLERYGGGAVGINAEALDEHEYRGLRNAGLNFAVLWQETYDEELYATYHPGNTKKTCFEYRLEAYERMLAAGIEAIGMGVLSGLSEWRTDWSLLMEHEAYLAKTYDMTTAILGVPRLKPAAGALVKSTVTIPSRQEFKCAVALHNLFAPSTAPFLSTREDWDLCREMASGGGALFTFNCSTIPGGYAAGRRGYQFPTGNYDAPLFAPRLAEQGFHPVFDWQFTQWRLVMADKGIAAVAGA
ncbi:MAG: radical SAM protein [bacterium]